MGVAHVWDKSLQQVAEVLFDIVVWNMKCGGNNCLEREGVGREGLQPGPVLLML